MWEMKMAQNETPETTEGAVDLSGIGPSDDDALRKRLLSRIAVAGVAILGLLSGLALFDALNKPPPAMPKMAAAPAQPIEPAVKPEEEKIAAEKPAEEQVAEEKTETPAEPERTEGALAPLKPAKPLTLPATPHSAAIKPPPAIVVPVKPDAPREIARAIPERTAPAHAPASRPLTQAVEGAKRLLVQVGVFSNHANAEELVAKLQEAGIPARIESHVQVGPFASRAEADAARAKLKALGLDEGLLVRR